MNLQRTGLELTILALGILLLGLVPYPRAFTAAMRQAQSHRIVREYGAALDAYQQAAGLDLEALLPWLAMGEVLISQHRFVEATVAFREAERLGGAGAALLGLGQSFAGRGDWATAIQTWLQARAVAPDDAGILVELGQGSIAQGRYDQAAGFLTQALELQPADGDAATAHALLGRLFVADDPASASEHFRQAGDEDMMAVLDIAGTEGDPARRNLVLGAAFLQRDELALARRYLERAVALAPADAEARAYLAHTLDRLGETVAARTLLEQALDLDPDSVLAYYFLGVHHRQVGNVESAQAALWEALLRDPENASLRVEMAQAFLDLGDYAQAEEWFRAAAEVTPGDVEFHLMLVSFYVDHLYRVEDGGVPAAAAAVALAPGDARAHDLLGWAYYLAGRSVEGRQALERALVQDPGLVSAHFHLGNLYANGGQTELARQHLQRAADLDTVGYYRNRAQMLLDDLD
jgi:tetratricopeptide (TPR) repeat protein